MTNHPNYFATRGAQERAYHAWVAADLAWMEELRRVYGARAGDARYDERSRSTPELRRLRAQFHTKREAYDAASATLNRLAA